MEKDIKGTRPVLEIVRAEPDPCRRIELIVENNLRYYFEAGDILKIIEREVTDGMSRLQAEYILCQRELSVLIEETLRQGTEEGVFRAIDPTEGTWILMALIEGTFALSYSDRENTRSLEKVAAVLTDAFFRIVKK